MTEHRTTGALARELGLRRLPNAVVGGLVALVTSLLYFSPGFRTEWFRLGYLFALILGANGLMHDTDSGWFHVMLTMPVSRRRLASVLWFDDIVLFPVAMVCAMTAAVPLVALYSATCLYSMADVPLALLATWAISGSFVFATNVCFRMGDGPECPLPGLNSVGNVKRRLFRLTYAVTGLAVAAFLSWRFPHTWGTLNLADGVTLAAGLALACLSFWRVRNVVFNFGMAEQGPHERPVAKPRPGTSDYPSTWAVMGDAYLSGAGICVLASTAFLGVFSFLEGSPFMPPWMAVFLAPVVVNAALPMRVYRTLPVSSAQLVQRFVVRCAILYGACLVPVCVYCAVWPASRHVILLALICVSFGMALLKNAVALVVSWDTRLLAIWLMLALVFAGGYTGDEPPFTRPLRLTLAAAAAVGCVLTLSAVAIAYAALTRSHRPYRPEKGSRM